jgi:N-acetylglutamate synthase-like GNAT family acetyltransferase
MDDFSLRPATKQDFRTIKTLINRARLNPTGLAWERFWLAEAAGEIIGCCQVRPHKDGSRELASLVVRDDWRGQGVARTLIEHFLVSEPGPLHLTCRTDLGPFYEKFGFRTTEVEEMPTYFKRVYRFINAGKLVGLENLRILVMVSGN